MENAYDCFTYDVEYVQLFIIIFFPFLLLLTWEEVFCSWVLCASVYGGGAVHVWPMLVLKLFIKISLGNLGHAPIPLRSWVGLIFKLDLYLLVAYFIGSL